MPQGALAFRWWGPEAVAGLLVWVIMMPELTPLTGYDWLRMHLPYKEVYPAAVWSGDWVEWNPFVAMGRPLLADIEGAFFYPFNVAFLLGPTVGAIVVMWLHWAILLRGMLKMAEGEGLGVLGAWLTALGFALCAPTLGRLQSGQFQVFCALAWWPWLLVATRRAITSPDLRGGLWLTLVGSLLVLAGSPPMLWIAWWLAIAWAVKHLVESEAPRRWGRWFVLAGGALVGVLLLSAVALWPFLEVAGLGNRSAGSEEYSLSAGMEGLSWLSIFLTRVDGRFSYWEFNLYLGAIPLLLAGLAIVKGRRRWCLGWLVVAVVFSLLSTGGGSFLLPLLNQWIPGWDAFRYPSRYAIGAILVILLLAGEGLRVLANWQGGRAHLVRIGAAVLLIIASLDLLRAGLDRRVLYSNGGNVPESREAEFAALIALQNQDEPSLRPIRVLSPNWVLRENSGMLWGYGMVTGFANPFLGNVWESIHETLDLESDPFDPVHLPAAVFAQPASSFAALSVDYIWRDLESPVERVESAEPWLALGGGPDSGAISLQSYQTDRMEIRVQTTTENEAIIADPWYPGWRAFIGDQELPVIESDGWKRSVAVPAGEHTVVMEFRSRWLRLGAWVSGLALVAWAFLFLQTRVQPAKASSSSNPK